MAVLTINREIIEKEGWTLGEFILMLCSINKIDLQAAKRLLVQKKLMTDHCPPEQYPPLGVAPMEEGVRKYNDIVIKCSPSVNGSPTTDEELDALSAEALDQINEKGYDTEMREEGVADIIKFGIAFSGKKVKIRTE